MTTSTDPMISSSRATPHWQSSSSLINTIRFNMHKRRQLQTDLGLLDIRWPEGSQRREIQTRSLSARPRLDTLLEGTLDDATHRRLSISHSLTVLSLLPDTKPREKRKWVKKKCTKNTLIGSHGRVSGNSRITTVCHSINCMYIGKSFRRYFIFS